MSKRKPDNSFVVIALLVIVVAAFLIYRARHANGPNSPSAPERAEARIGPADIYPDAARTPGAANPEITPANIQENICNPYWSTKSVRPAVSYTNRLKREQIQDFADADTNPRDYEEDHLIPLEIGGNPTDPRNLWPEPYETSIPDGGARYKDKVENYLHEQVCGGNIGLEQAQREIATDWYRVYVTSVR